MRSFQPVTCPSESQFKPANSQESFKEGAQRGLQDSRIHTFLTRLDEGIDRHIVDDIAATMFWQDSRASNHGVTLVAHDG